MGGLLFQMRRLKKIREIDGSSIILMKVYLGIPICLKWSYRKASMRALMSI
jgi:hypothetical protein